jgi:hypothetical protein
VLDYKKKLDGVMESVDREKMKNILRYYYKMIAVSTSKSKNDKNYKNKIE